MSISEEAVVDPAVDPEIIPPQTRRLVGTPIEDQADDEDAPPDPDEVTTLTDEERRDLTMLMTCGRRTKTLTLMGGHKVRVQTLKSIDEMRIGLYTKPHLGSQGFSRAYQVAVCAAGIIDVDGEPLSTSLLARPDPQDAFDKAIEKLEQYYPPVVVEIYEAILGLEIEFSELAEKLGKPSG